MAKHLENPTISSSSKKESIKSSLFFAGFSEACLHTHPWLPTLHQFHLNQGLDKPSEQPHWLLEKPGLLPGISA